MPESPCGRPHVVVFSSLFPSSLQPGAGLFVRERMFRVGRELPLAVVAPAPWFPLQGLLRRWKPGFRVGAPRYELQQDFDVWFPRFFSTPGILKSLDGWTMALGALPQMWRLKREGRLDLIDAHFAYPDGYAAGLLGQWLDVPVTITLRGTEARLARDARLAPYLRRALSRAKRVFAVSDSLRRVAIDLGTPPEKVLVVGNGVALEKFHPMPKAEARSKLGLAPGAKVLVTVGALVERKGFHRVIELLPALRERFPGLIYLVVGGPSPEGDWTQRLSELTTSLGLADAVRFLGPLQPDELRVPLSASTAFVLSSRNEGWANVLLEAMGCGLPVVATDVGGNAEVVNHPDLGVVVPFGDGGALRRAIEQVLTVPYQPDPIRAYAERNTWDLRVSTLVQEFQALARPPSADGLKGRVGHA